MKSKQRRVFENLQDDEDDDEEEEELDMTEMDSLNDASGVDGSSGGNKSPIGGFDYDIDDEDQQQRTESSASISRVYLNVPNQRTIVNNRNINSRRNFDNTTSDFDEFSSYLPNESLPNIDDVLDNTNNSYLFNVESGDKVVRQRKVKNRPSLLNYYGDVNTSSTSTTTNTNSSSKKSMNEQDIDETFDFLDEELNK